MSRPVNERPCVLCIFAKPPVAGRSKTRLAAGVGAEAAAELARAFVQDTWAAAQRLSWARPIVASTVEDPAALGLGAEAELWLQGSGGLEQRLERIFQRALREGEAAIAMGADSPGLPADRLLEAWSLLRSHDAVLGPAEDGGFYLLGLRRCPPGLLDDIPWSAPDTAAKTVARLRAAGMSVAELAPWFDVDVPEDLVRLRDVLAEDPQRAPKTWAVLQRHDRPSASARISVVIPVLNEEAVIARRLDELARLAVHEIVVVDGGSTDRTRELVAAHAGVRWVQTAPGRAAQMNAGAALATGDVLLFLHADVALPEDAVFRVNAALAEPEVVAGAFRTWTVADRPSRLGPLLHLADLRSRYSGLPYGDQALFVRTGTFRKLGGFAPLPLMEDLELSRRLRREGTIRIVPARVTVSGRRFIERPVFYTLLVNVYPALFRLGVPAERLAAGYRHVR